MDDLVDSLMGLVIIWVFIMIGVSYLFQIPEAFFIAIGLLVIFVIMYISQSPEVKARKRRKRKKKNK
ncbi:hypothetical protein LCGC14_0495350 [marine sediment metagenome]|uniref:Uncharacterized protein n=1 Tax=marine sediment metagenome TaxID=412755 RepID=A0A0F9VE77_9ZZZZ|nr:hypothetical protein [bacterium]